MALLVMFVVSNLLWMNTLRASYVLIIIGSLSKSAIAKLAVCLGLFNTPVASVKHMGAARAPPPLQDRFTMRNNDPGARSAGEVAGAVRSRVGSAVSHGPDGLQHYQGAEGDEAPQGRTREGDALSTPAGGSRATLTSHELRLLGLMAEAAKLSPEAFLGGIVRALPGVSGYADLDGARFDTLADAFVGIGFRHPALPLLSAAQRACLNRGRRRLGLSARAALAMFRESTGLGSSRQMTGSHFLGLMAAFERLGVGEPLPLPGFMNRRRAATLRRKAWLAGVDDLALRERMMKLGGTIITRGLDGRAYNRVVASLGGVEPLPAPSVDGDPGMVTQAQANLIWRLWLDARRGRDASEAALDLAIELMLGFPGGLETLTRAGARAVMDAIAASQVQALDLSARRPEAQTATGRPS